MSEAKKVVSPLVRFIGGVPIPATQQQQRTELRLLAGKWARLIHLKIKDPVLREDALLHLLSAKDAFEHAILLPTVEPTDVEEEELPKEMFSKMNREFQAFVSPDMDEAHVRTAFVRLSFTQSFLS